jgi:hypothetical protein
LAALACILGAGCLATDALAQNSDSPGQSVPTSHPRPRPTKVGATLGPSGTGAPTRAEERFEFESAVADLRRLVEAQGEQLERQAKIIEAQGRDIDALRRQLGSTVAVTERSSPVIQQEAQPQTETTGQEPERVPEMPAPVVSAGDFPRSFRIPGTESAVRLGGQARMTTVQSFGPLGTDDRFVTSSIPVEGEQQPGEDKRTNYSASPSRINLDLRSQTPIGSVRSFFEADFAGSGNAMRLRHAFMQTQRWVGGQTWSTFSDPEAEPLGIDFEGLNAISLFRQPLIRYTHPLRPNLGLAIALEDPAPDLTGAQGVNLTPDFVARLRWDPEKAPGPKLFGRAAHVQAAVLVRTLRGEPLDQPEVTLSTGGFGVNVSGVTIPRWDPEDRIKFASNFGWGIGKYITDLGTLGGQDAVYDSASNTLRALSVSSAYVGYERQWRPRLTTAVTYGVVNVGNLDIQPDNSLHRTERATINITWTPISNADLVLEFLSGTRENKDRKRGTSTQLQAGWLFRF